MTLLARFNGTNGMLPASGLTLGPDGAFYGTTAMGGASGFGTIYRISRSGDLTTLASFSGTNGAGPYSGLTLGPDGSFYGITAFRGKESGPSYGTIFKVTTNGVLTMVMALDGFLARNPTGELTLTSKGELWGVMNDMRKRAAGDGNAGLIFKLVESNYPHPAQTIATIARKPITAEFTNGVLYLSGGKRQQKMN